MNTILKYLLLASKAGGSVIKKLFTTDRTDVKADSSKRIDTTRI